MKTKNKRSQNQKGNIIMLPTIQVDGKLTKVCSDDKTLWFSYTTLVAFRVKDLMFVHENIWSNTTGKHLTEIDGGSPQAKAKRLTKQEFENKWNELTKE